MIAKHDSRHFRIINFTVGVMLTGVMIFFFLTGTAHAVAPERTYLYNLSSFTGPVPSLWSRLSIDEETGEVYSLNRGEASIQIFNVNAMMIHSFGEDYPVGGVADIAVGSEGDIFMIEGAASGGRLLRLDYKGELKEIVALKNVPEAFLPLAATRLEYRDRKVYLLDVTALRLVVVTAEGEFLAGYKIRDQLAATAGDDERYRKEISEMDFNGFSVDSHGAIYFTAPTSFTAYKMEHDGTIRGFGKSGSGPGKFGVIAGIVADSKGNIYISDRLRSVVMVFDQDFKFVREFGYRGAGPENLIAPDDIELDEENAKLYVAQAANRGVSVFRLKTE